MKQLFLLVVGIEGRSLFLASFQMITSVKTIILCYIVICFIHQSVALRSKRPRLELWRPRNLDTNALSESNNDESSLHIHKTILKNYGFSTLQVDSMANSFPVLSKLDPYDAIQPKLEFFSNTCAYCPKHIWREKLLAYPNILGLHLINTIAPRHAYLTLLGIHEQLLVGDKWQFLDLITYKDEQFLQACQSHCSTDITAQYPTFFVFKQQFIRGGLAAIRTLDPKMLQLLLTHGYHPDDELDRQNRSILMWTCGQDNSQGKVVKLINVLDAFYRQSTASNDHFHHRCLSGDTVFHWASTGTQTLSVYEYLWHQIGCEEVLQWVNKEGSHALHWAAGHGQLDLVAYWLHRHGLSPAIRNIFGCTPGHFAASRGHIAVLQYLAEAYANVSVSSNRDGREARITYLTQQNDHGHDCLTKAIAFHQHGMVEWLLTTYPELIPTVSMPRTWTEDTATQRNETVTLTLFEIAQRVHNIEGYQLLQRFHHNTTGIG